MARKKIHNLYFSPDQIRMIKSKRMSWAGHVTRTGGMRYAFNTSVGKTEGKRPLETPPCRGEEIH
jgi:hypothetical protein